MRKIFWEDPYQCQLNTQVVSVNQNRLLLAETIIFSFAGGQESDLATINGMPVISSEIENNLIYYILPDGHGIHNDDSVSIEIDWPRRYKLMRLHFAAELILEIITHKYSLEKIGAHIAENKARIDFNYDKNISSIFPEILPDYNAIIAKDAIIKTGYTDVENQRRYWEIDGFSKVSCGGTHVKSTAEVGFVTLKRKNIGRSKERVEIMLVDQ